MLSKRRLRQPTKRQRRGDNQNNSNYIGFLHITTLGSKPLIPLDDKSPTLDSNPHSTPAQLLRAARSLLSPEPTHRSVPIERPHKTLQVF